MGMDRQRGQREVSRTRADEPDEPDQGLPDPEPEPEPEPTEKCMCVSWPPCTRLAVGAYDLCAECANDDDHVVRTLDHRVPSITEMYLLH